MSDNNVTYSIALVPENAPKIDAINRIMLGGDYTAEAPAPEKKSGSSQSQAATENESSEDSTSVTLDDVKTAAKAAKKEHGEEFAMAVLKDNDVDVKTTLGRSMGAIPEDKYETVIEMWQAGPIATQDDDLPEDDLEDDLDDDFDDEDEGPSVESVQTALKAYAKEKGRDQAKEIMQKHGAAALSKVADCTAAQLTAMMKELA